MERMSGFSVIAAGRA